MLAGSSEVVVDGSVSQKRQSGDGIVSAWQSDESEFPEVWLSLGNDEP